MGNKGFSDVEVSSFSFKLQQLLDVGIPLLRALSLVRSTSNKSQQERFEELESRLHAGGSLANALRSIYFPSFYCSLIAFSEQHGQLTETLELTYQYYFKRNVRKQQLRKILTYPLLVLISSGITMSMILFFLLPQFISLYQTLGIPLPWTIQYGMGITSHVWLKWTVFFLFIFSLSGSVYLYRNRRFHVTQTLLQVPLFSGLLKLHLNYLLTTQLALLLEGGIQILEICRLFREESSTKIISEAFVKIDAQLRKGKSLSEAFREIPWLLPVFIDLVSIAEQSGKVAPTLKSLGEQFERELDTLMNRVANYIENILLVGTGGAVFIMLLSLFYPMLNIIGQL